MAVAVKNSRRPAALAATSPLPDILNVERFRVVVSGSDFSPPIEVFFPSDTASGQISGIPVGDNRTVLIEALNHTGMVIRRRELSGISIAGGEPTPVVATLLSVPIVTNLSNGNLVTQTRLMLKGYAEPAAGLQVEEINGATPSSVLTDISTSSSVVTPALSDGGFEFHPQLLALGPHTFRIRDTGTGQENIVTVTLVRPGRTPGVGLGLAGKTLPASRSTATSLGRFSETLETMLQ